MHGERNKLSSFSISAFIHPGHDSQGNERMEQKIEEGSSWPREEDEEKNGLSLLEGIAGRKELEKEVIE